MIRKTAPKPYWAILKTFVNDSKMQLIPPLLVDNKLVTEFLGFIPKKWKKANVIPVHKKGDKQMIASYRPVPLLPICDF